MPLQKRIEHEDEEQHAVHYIAPMSFTPWSLAGFAEVGWRMSAWWTAAARGLIAKGDPQQPDIPRVGKYYADYSELTSEQIGQHDAKLEDLFKRSKPVSR
jgi:hypothetical protein